MQHFAPLYFIKIRNETAIFFILYCKIGRNIEAWPSPAEKFLYASRDIYVDRYIINKYILYKIPLLFFLKFRCLNFKVPSVVALFQNCSCYFFFWHDIIYIICLFEIYNILFAFSVKLKINKYFRILTLYLLCFIIVVTLCKHLLSLKIISLINIDMRKKKN